MVIEAHRVVQRWLTACWQRVPLSNNVWWRRGGQRTLLLNTPGLLNGREAQQRLQHCHASDPHWEVESAALPPAAIALDVGSGLEAAQLTRTTFPRVGALADGRASTVSLTAKVRFGNGT